MAGQTYAEFLRAKATVAGLDGFPVDLDEINPLCKPHQRKIVQWAVAGGRRAIFAAFGLGKTVMQLEAVRLTIDRAGGKGLIVCPLGVQQEFIHDAAMLGMPPLRRIRTTAEAEALPDGAIALTNYEPVRDGKLDPNLFTVVSLDEAAILRSFGSKTYQTFLTLFDKVPHRFVATATPSPNRYKELIHYAGFLGIMETGQALTRFFKRDSTQANNLTLLESQERAFWLWLASWSAWVQSPADLCDCGCFQAPAGPVALDRLPRAQLALVEEMAKRLLRSVGQGPRRWEQGEQARHVLHVRRCLSDQEISHLPAGPEPVDRAGDGRRWRPLTTRP